MSLGHALVVHEQCDEGVALMTGVTDVLVKGSEDDPRMASARWTLGACQARLGRDEDAAQTLRLALDAMPDPSTDRAGVMLELARVEHGMGSSEQAMRRLDDVLAFLAADETDPAMEVGATLFRAMLEAGSGAHAQGAQRAKDVLARIRKTPLAAHRQVGAFVDAARVLAEAGELRDARAIAQQAEALVQRSGLSAKIAEPILAGLTSVLRLTGDSVGEP